MRTREAPKGGPRAKRIAGVLGVPSRSDLGEGRVGIATLDRGDGRTPRGQRGRHVRTGWEGKPGTPRGSPRRSRTAKASRISRPAVKSRCAGEWGGWGRLSEDGPGQHNPDPSEGPWGGGRPTLHSGASSGRRPGAVRGNRSDPEVHEGRWQTGRQQVHTGSRLKPLTILGRPRLTGQPSSRTGENPPYGMRGGIEETSASFEARSAPRSYPTSGLAAMACTSVDRLAQRCSIRAVYSAIGPYPLSIALSFPMVHCRSRLLPSGSKGPFCRARTLIFITVVRGALFLHPISGSADGRLGRPPLVSRVVHSFETTRIKFGKLRRPSLRRSSMVSSPSRAASLRAV